MNWPDAESLIAAVENEHGNEISQRQLPLRAFLAIGLMVAGVGMTAYGIFVLFAFWRTMQLDAGQFAQPTSSPAEKIINEGISQYNLANNLMMVVNAVPFAFQIIFFGAALMAASYFGMKQVWMDIFGFLGI
jgi:hypothetical protein